jgi:hypothetical protein
MKNRTAAAALALITSLSLLSVKADNMAYEGEGNADFGTIDLTTGAFTYLGNPGVVITGMATEGATLYGGSYNNGFLYTINTANGSLTPIGNSGVAYDTFGSTTAGMFAVGRDGNLYSVNPSTGAATLVGPTGIPISGTRGLSTEDSALYYSVDADLYTLNTSTGAATLVGNTGGTYMGALLLEGGILYGGADSPSIQVVEVNPLTAAITSGPDETGAASDFWSLAPDPLTTNSVPDEASTLRLLLGVVGICRFLVRRRS